MPNMEDIGLVGLTHILNGGVRIQHNPSLCYARNGDGEIYKGPINWRKILKNEYYPCNNLSSKSSHDITDKRYLFIVTIHFYICCLSIISRME